MQHSFLHFRLSKTKGKTDVFKAHVKGKNERFANVIVAAPTERRKGRFIRAMQLVTKKSLKEKSDVLKMPLADHH